MKIKITMYKSSGKYYTEEIVENDKDILLFEKEFKEFVKKNLPATLENGYVTVEDVDLNQSFHECLYVLENGLLK